MSYGYPEVVLNYIGELAPGDIVREIREDAFVVNLEEFCEAISIPKVDVTVYILYKINIKTYFSLV